MPGPEAFTSVILAAGKGHRFGPLGRLLPKALLPVLERPLIAWQLEALRRSGIEEAVIVIGHLGDRIRESLGDGRAFGMRLVYREQEEPRGIAHALACAREVVEKPFILLLGDIHFDPGDVGGILDAMRSPEADGVLVVRDEEDVSRVRHNYSVELDPAGRVGRVVEKPTRPATTLKGTGLYGFRPSFFEAVARTQRSGLRDEYELTDAIQVHVDQGARLVTYGSRSPDCNVSSVADLLELNLHALAGRGARELVVDAGSIGEGARLDRTIVLAGATVAPGAHLEECLVLQDERVPSGRHRRAVFAAGGVVECG